MKKIRLFILMFASLFAIIVQAQDQTISGTVVDESGEPVIGASVVKKGTTQGSAVTNLDGQFTVQAATGSTLVISYVGFLTQEVKATPNMTVKLHGDTKNLNEVVVIGYGTQKKSVVTAAIAKVTAEDLAGTAPVRMDNALKGLAAGVQVTSSSGQPGAAARVRIRGIGTINDSNPIYVVDGMPIEGGIDYINPNDIQSIEVLKDASSCAIYGTRGANGVVLVTTKKGKMGKVAVNYNFSYGWQNPWRKRDVLNATQYAVMMNEGLINAGMAPKYADPYSYGEGTNWQDEVFNDNAPVSNHDLSISGASEKMNYYLSLGYYKQDGIVGGNYDRSNYERLTLRSNTKYNLFDVSNDRNWLNRMDVTVNVSYARVKSTGIDVNSQYGSPLGSALALSPILTPTLTAEGAAAQNKEYESNPDYVPMYDKNGNMYTIAGAEYNEMTNPLASLSLPGSQGWSHKFVTDFIGELQIWDGLKYRISYSTDMSFWGSDSHQVLYFMTNTNKSTHTSASSESDRGTVWQLENTLTYDKTFGQHTINVVLGQSALRNTGWSLGGTRYNLIDVDKPYINYCTGQFAKGGEMNVWGGPSNPHKLSSLFARVSYNYAERYMVQATVRRDGSSRFGSNNKYATFPSFSLGWNVLNEPFMKNHPNWISAMKIRGGWGENGNESIGDFAYTVVTSTGNNYIFGKPETITNGVKASGLANPDLKWEKSKQTDIGVDFGFLDNSLTFTVDYYKKKTSGMLMTMAIPSYVGEAKPIGNVGDMENSGVEFEAGYKFHIADAHFNVKGNMSYLHNKVVKLGNDNASINYDAIQTAGTITRAECGEPFPFFYGLKTAGIFQNQAEIDAYVDKDGKKIQPNAKPGYVRFVDENGDGKIDDNDRVKIGKGTPDWSFGLNFNADWRGFDFSMMWQGTIGNDICDATRRVDVKSVNLPTWMLSRWTGEGTSNKYPIFIIGDNVNWKSSDLYIHDGSYLRLKNIQLGYTLPAILTKKYMVEKLRVFVSAENLLTFTKYWGFDPEISSGGTSLGVDYGVYPQSRVWTIGFNIGF
jgi:TonB-linked SusC/RagA family outer membrane protein